MNRHLLTLYCIIVVLIFFIVVLLLQNPPQLHNEVQSDQGNTQNNSDYKQLNNLTLKDQICPINQFVIAINSKGEIACSEMSKTSQSNINSTDMNKLECYDHGFIENGFCTCDEGWTGPECQDPQPTLSKNAPLDNDKDNVPAPLDCDDNDDLVYPGAPDSIDGKDNNCNGEIDEGY